MSHGAALSAGLLVLLASCAGTLAQTIDEFVLSDPGSAPFGITAGPDGNLWFAEFLGGQIGRSMPAGVITEFPAGSGLRLITSGPDGALGLLGLMLAATGRSLLKRTP
jgi:virginiamycin B lyase